MKRVFTTLMILCMCQCAWAQYRHEFSLSYGLLTANQMFDLSSDIAYDNNTIEKYNRQNVKGTGGFFLSYKNAFTDRLSAGVTFGIEQNKGDLFLNDRAIGSYTRRFTLLALEGEYRYTEGDLFQLFSGAGLGFNFGQEKFDPVTGPEEKDSLGLLTWQVNAIGLRIGDQLGASLALGFGYRGVINFGIFYQL